MKKKTPEFLFDLVATVFSAALLVLSLLCAIELAAVNDRAAALEKETESLKTENQILLTQCENSISLAELESYAINELGMQRPAPGQIKYIEFTEQVDGR